MPRLNRHHSLEVASFVIQGAVCKLQNSRHRLAMDTICQALAKQLGICSAYTDNPDMLEDAIRAIRAAAAHRAEYLRNQADGTFTEG